MAAILFAIVLRRSANRPALVFPQMCVKPRNENVSGGPRPRRLRFSAANRPNSIRRVFSALSSRLNRQNAAPGPLEPLGVRAMLKTGNDVVGEAHDDHITVRLPPPPMPAHRSKT